MKRGLIFIVSVIILISSGCKHAPEGVVAQVDATDIRIADLDAEVSAYDAMKGDGPSSDMKMPPDETKRKEDRRKLLEKLIRRAVLEQEVQREGLNANGTSFSNFEREKIDALGGEQEYEQFLAANSIQKAIFTNFLHDEFLKSLLREQYVKTHPLSDALLKKTFDEKPERFYRYDFQLLLFGHKKEAEEVMRSMHPLHETALFHSLDTVSAADGGFVMDYKPGGYEEAVDEALPKMEEGKLYGPIEGTMGFYVIRFLKAHRDFGELKEHVRQYLIDRQFHDYLEELRKTAKVKIFED